MSKDVPDGQGRPPERRYACRLLLTDVVASRDVTVAERIQTLFDWMGDVKNSEKQKTQA